MNEYLYCNICGDPLKYHDSVRRIVRGRNRETTWIKVPRYKCSRCRCIHRKLPMYIFPYKQYSSDIIFGVIDGLITCETLGYEDYPCEMTMNRWLKMYKDDVTEDNISTDIVFTNQK